MFASEYRFPAEILTWLENVINYRLSLFVSANTVYKPSMVRSWLKHQPEIQSAWVRLTPQYNHPVSFSEQLSTHLTQRFTIAPDPPFSNTLMDAMVEWINKLSSAPRTRVLALQNYQVITNAEIHSAIELLLDYTPPKFHLLILSSQIPPLPIARLRARRLLSELELNSE